MTDHYTRGGYRGGEPPVGPPAKVPSAAFEGGAPAPGEVGRVCTYLRWHDTNCAVGDATGICGRYAPCPLHPDHPAASLLSAPSASETPGEDDLRGERHTITRLREQYPENGPLGSRKVGPDDTLTTEAERLHRLASHRLSAMTEIKRAQAAAVEQRALAEQEAERLRAENGRLDAIRRAVMDCPDDARRELYRADLIAGEHIVRADRAEAERDAARAQVTRVRDLVLKARSVDARGCWIVRTAEILDAIAGPQ